jgi:hypothetical protein
VPQRDAKLSSRSFALFCQAQGACKVGVLAELHASSFGGRPVIDGGINGHRIEVLVDTGGLTAIALDTAPESIPLHCLGVGLPTSPGRIATCLAHGSANTTTSRA